MSKKIVIPKLGDKVFCYKLSLDSFYKQIQGEIVGIRNGWASIRVEKFIDKWSSEWVSHPGNGVTSAQLNNLEYL